MTLAEVDERKTVPVSSVVLNPKNFRHRPAESQEQALQYLFGDDLKRGEMLALATDIAERGLDPSSLPIVEPLDGHWRVLEGNRRFAVMKVLLNPDALPTLDGLTATALKTYREKFVALGSDAIIPTDVLCFVTSDRDRANHLIALKHTGTGVHKGAGTVIWDTEGRTRYETDLAERSGKRPSPSNRQTAQALMLLDALSEVFRDDAEIRDLIDRARKGGLTTLGRLINNAANRQRLGVVIEGGSARFIVGVDVLRSVMVRILTDLGTEVLNSRTTNKAANVTEYLDSIADELPSDEDRLEDSAGSADSDSGSESGGASEDSGGSGASEDSDGKRERRRKRDPVMRMVFKGMKLNHASPKTWTFLKEMATLKIDEYPYVLACSMRTLIDLYTGDVIRALGMPEEESPSRRARKCLRLLEPEKTKSKDRKFPRISDALAEQTGDLSIDTMNGFMHRPHHDPTPATIRVQVEYYRPWLEALDSYVDEQLIDEE